MVVASAPIISSSFSKLPNYHPVPQIPLTAAIKRRQSMLSICCSLVLDTKDERLPGSESGGQSGEAPSGLHVVFVGGVSDGHIFPALAIAEGLKNACPTTQIVFLGTDTNTDIGMERDVVPAAGYDFIPVAKVRLARPFLAPQNLFLPFQLLRSIITSCRILRHLNCDIVVGTGAYISTPICFAVVLMRRKLIIQE